MPTPTPSTERPLRFCDICGGLDDHPRHVIDGVNTGKPPREFLESIATDGASAAALEQLFNPTTLVRHQDCCAANGCPVCQATEELNGGARGDALLESIQSGVTDDLEAPDLPREMTHEETV